MIDVFQISSKSSDSSDSSKSSDSSESSESSKSSKASASVGRLSSYSFKNYFLRFPKLQIWQPVIVFTHLSSPFLEKVWIVATHNDVEQR